MQMAKMEKSDMVETLRKSLVHCMKAGDTLVLNCDKLSPDFKTMFDGCADFPLDDMMQFDHWRKETEYIKVVRKEEKDQDYYAIHNDFCMCFLQTYTNDEAMHEFVSKIPHADKQQILIVEWD